MTFLDANVFLRYLIPGDADKAEACRQLFRQIQSGQVRATTSGVVVAEIVYVLSSSGGAGYNLKRDDIADRLLPLICLSGLVFGDKQLVLRALDLYVSYPFLDFADAMTAAQVMSKDEVSVTSYDRDFDRISGLVRVEPGK